MHPPRDDFIEVTWSRDETRRKSLMASHENRCHIKRFLSDKIWTQDLLVLTAVATSKYFIATLAREA